MMKKIFSIFFSEQILGYKSNWKEAWNIRSFRLQIISAFVTLLIIASLIPIFFNHIQSVSGYSFNDFILNELEPQDLSLYIFLLIYSAILLSSIHIVASPFLLLKFFQGYALLLIVRIFCIYLVPLEPEKAMIPLKDPFVGRLFYNNIIITKDLFFSGHVSTMSLFVFIVPFRPLKYFLIVTTCLVAFLILVQHVHYTIDVLAAPIFAWLCFFVADHFSHNISKFS